MVTGGKSSHYLHIDEAIVKAWTDTLITDVTSVDMRITGTTVLVVQRLCRSTSTLFKKATAKASKYKEGKMSSSKEFGKGFPWKRKNKGATSTNDRAPNRKTSVVCLDGSPKSQSDGSEAVLPGSPSGEPTEEMRSKDQQSNPVPATPSKYNVPTIMQPARLKKVPGPGPIITEANLLSKSPKLQSQTQSKPSDSTTPPSFGISPVSLLSTAATSLLSDPNSLLSPQSHESKLRKGHWTGASVHHQGGAGGSSLLSVDENDPEWMEEAKNPQSLFKPSIETIEVAAAVKTFFELYFDELLFSECSPRSLRRRDFERKLQKASMTDRQHAHARQQWFQAENTYTRESRIFKTATAVRRDSPNAVAQYEVIRVLGKGSFGLVNLVTERNEMTSRSTGGVDASGKKSDGSASHRSKRRKKSSKPASAGNLFAMKIIRKSDMLRDCQEAHLRAERDFMVKSEGSTWIVPLISTFQDNTNLYLVMEYMAGGDFMGFLLREDVLDEGTARWYIAEMILCIKEVHRMGWIHRDIKPDNFLVTDAGHLKISDFGLSFDSHWAHSQSYHHHQRYDILDRYVFNIIGDSEDQDNSASEASPRLDSGGRSKHAAYATGPFANVSELIDWRNRCQRRDVARSIVGTSQYMAPEVILGRPYDRRSDWWSLGIIMYECLYGSTPFWRGNRELTKDCIVNHRTTLSFAQRDRWSRPSTEFRRWLPPVSETAIDLMMRILTERDERMPQICHRANEIKSGRLKHIKSGLWRQDRVDRAADKNIEEHAWFDGIQWEHMHVMRPPFVPTFRPNQSIAKYFEDEKYILGDSTESAAPSVNVPMEGQSGRGATSVAAVDGAAAFSHGTLPTRTCHAMQQGEIMGSSLMRAPGFDVNDLTDQIVSTSRYQTHKFWPSLDDEGAPNNIGQATGGDGSEDCVQVPGQCSRRSMAVQSNGRAEGRFTARSDPLHNRDVKNHARSVAGEGHKLAASSASKKTQPSAPTAPVAASKRKRRVHRRARDRILRDPQYGHRVMEVRKRFAFLGYSYRRRRDRAGTPWLEYLGGNTSNAGCSGEPSCVAPGDQLARSGWMSQVDGIAEEGGDMVTKTKTHSSPGVFQNGKMVWRL